MKMLRAYFKIVCYVELPEPDYEADVVFEGIEDAIVRTLDGANIGNIVVGSLAIDDAQTEPEDG